MQKYLVIAGNHIQYLQFSNRKAFDMWNSGDTSVTLSDFIYLDNVERIRGFHEIPPGWFYGTWYERKDIEILLETLFVYSKFRSQHNRAKVFADMMVKLKDLRKAP